MSEKMTALRAFGIVVPMAGWRDRVRELKREVAALAYACRDPRVPWVAKALAVAVVAYALSPIDLIPDFIPVLGYLDDLILLPLGILLAVKLIPPAVMADCRQRAREGAFETTRARWAAAAVIAVIWLAALIASVRLVWS